MSTTQPEALRENYTAADMATASAQGFRDGVASVAASAGSEPVAQPGDAEAILSKICDLFHIGKLARTESTILTNIRNVIDHAGLLHAVERDLFPHPELPEDDDPYAAVDEGPPAPNSWAAKSEADYVAQFRAALAARGFTHPSPPEGAGWKWVPKILSAEMVDAWASARLPGGIAQMTDDEANRAVAQANWDSMIAAAPPPPAQAADSVLEDADPIRALIGQHAAILAQNESAYFELCYHRTTGWMSWITDKPLCMPPVVNPDRKVLAQGQGDTADEACRDAARRQGGA